MHILSNCGIKILSWSATAFNAVSNVEYSGWLIVALCMELFHAYLIAKRCDRSWKSLDTTTSLLAYSVSNKFCYTQGPMTDPLGIHESIHVRESLLIDSIAEGGNSFDSNGAD